MNHPPQRQKLPSPFNPLSKVYAAFRKQLPHRQGNNLTHRPLLYHPHTVKLQSAPGVAPRDVTATAEPLSIPLAHATTAQRVVVPPASAAVAAATATTSTAGRGGAPRRTSGESFSCRTCGGGAARQVGGGGPDCRPSGVQRPPLFF